jgi:hypothetical protein
VSSTRVPRLGSVAWAELVDANPKASRQFLLSPGKRIREKTPAICGEKASALPTGLDHEKTEKVRVWSAEGTQINADDETNEEERACQVRRGCPACSERVV